MWRPEKRRVLSIWIRNNLKTWKSKDLYLKEKKNKSKNKVTKTTWKKKMRSYLRLKTKTARRMKKGLILSLNLKI
jgi:hypothetical protein